MCFCSGGAVENTPKKLARVLHCIHSRLANLLRCTAVPLPTQPHQPCPCMHNNWVACVRVACGRDVTTSMANDGVEDIRDFKWESQLRYYWEHNDGSPSGIKNQVGGRSAAEWRNSSTQRPLQHQSLTMP